MEPMTLQATAEDAGKRLDAWLAEQTVLSRSALQRLAEEGRITSEGRPLAKNARLTGSETVTVSRPAPEAIDVVPQNIPLEVVYEDADVIVVNKPKGLVVHPAPQDRCRCPGPWRSPCKTSASHRAAPPLECRGRSPGHG